MRMIFHIKITLKDSIYLIDFICLPIFVLC